jgi:uncharacterized protein (DUF305 family)
MLTQHGQIGVMQGWLDAWGLSSTGENPPMAWMGDDATSAMPDDKGGTDAFNEDDHAMDSRMPGLATPKEVAALSTLPVPEMEAQFLRLMIRHHQGGVLMAEAAVERAETDNVRDLAGWIVAGQQAEIAQMEKMLSERA